jgi:hypothetical protein
MSLLTFHPVVQDFPRPRLEKPEEILFRRIAENPELTALADKRIALAVGSRKIAGLSALVKAAVAALRRWGAEVFIVPAMGSHGGGDAESQRRVLEGMGVTEHEMGATLVAREELTLAGKTASGLPVWVDAAAWEADGIVPINRVKPHTAFRAAVESGPSKLLAVGLGKGKSAETLHRSGLARSIPEVLQFFLTSGKLPLGVGIAENAWGETAEVALLSPAGWLEEEAALLQQAWALYPRLPWDELDLLVVEKMGKDVSGTGMDINVIGMNRRFADSASPPRIGQVVALDLSDASDGNATGVGYADIITKRLASRIDWEKTRYNCQISGFLDAARRPLVAEDEDDAIRRALAALGGGAASDPAGCRAVKIFNTSSLVNLQVSPALLERLPPSLRRV